MTGARHRNDAQQFENEPGGQKVHHAGADHEPHTSGGDRLDQNHVDHGNVVRNQQDRTGLGKVLGPECSQSYKSASQQKCEELQYIIGGTQCATAGKECQHQKENFSYDHNFFPWLEISCLKYSGCFNNFLHTNCLNRIYRFNSTKYSSYNLFFQELIKIYRKKNTFCLKN
jgi:hypothetical protein